MNKDEIILDLVFQLDETKDLLLKMHFEALMKGERIAFLIENTINNIDETLLRIVPYTKIDTIIH